MASLPKSFNLAEPIPSLPDGAMSQLVTCRPISGTTFGPQSIIEVELGSRGWCDPQSIAIRYKATATQTAVSSSSAITGTPVYTPFQRVSTLCGGASLDSINGYNQTAHVLTTGNLDVASKYGLMACYGYTQAPTANLGNMQYLDGHLITGSPESFYMSAPLIGTLLTNSTKQLPLFALPAIRFQFTLDSLQNMSYSAVAGTDSVTYNTMADFQITNFELVYNMCDMGSAVEKMVYDMGPTISIKTHGLSNSAVSVSAGTSGSQSFVFNQRFASIRSAFICPSKTTGSKWAELVDLTSGATGGDYSLLVGQQAFPQAPLSTVLNRSGILQETRRAFGNLYENNSFSINSAEFSRTVATANDGTTSPYYEPGKFICGVNLSKVQTGDKAVMSGVSTFNSPISVNVNINVATAVATNLNLILDYDAILVIDPRARQLSVRS